MHMNYLIDYTKSMITVQELFSLLLCDNYEAFYKLVKELEEQNQLVAVKAAGRNGRVPYLYNRYRVKKADKPNHSYIDEITGLHSSLNIEGYLADQYKYKSHRDMILPISEALGKRPDWFISRMSVNEKSFLLYGLEKLLVKDRRKIEGILTFNKLSWSDFHIYETPEPFFSRNLIDHPGMKDSILVLENKDIWYTLMDIARELHISSIFLENVTCLSYGEGNKVCREQGSLTSYIKQAFPSYLDKCIWYAGDVDSEGVRIWQRVCKNNPELSIHLHPTIYKIMYSWAETTYCDNIFTLPASEDQRNALLLTESEWQSFLIESGAEEVFTKKDIELLAATLTAGSRIPQEAANRFVLMNIIKSNYPGNGEFNDT